jgi:pyruvate dehydrogenase E2 component (dihydrolipoamide acetyltransferase)
MATVVSIPKLGTEMTEGTVLAWLKKEGDPVEKGEPLFELMTDKASVDVESPQDGVVARILIEVDRPYPVGTAAAIVAAVGEDVTDLGVDAPSPMVDN